MNFYHLVVQKGGVIQLPERLLQELGWELPAELAIDAIEGGITIQLSDVIHA